MVTYTGMGTVGPGPHGLLRRLCCEAPVHEWFEGNRLGAALLWTSSRRHETTLARLLSGHTRAQRHMAGLKVYSSCPNSNLTQAAPTDILTCSGYQTQSLLRSLGEDTFVSEVPDQESSSHLGMA
ncbi:hypothetical protein TNCV_4892821 [Trichonephila clavipes]|nr:hypothetical protein TNCV_4892821 [Trichonephila clavipes]